MGAPSWTTLPWLDLKLLSQKTWKEKIQRDRHPLLNNEDPCLPPHSTAQVRLSSDRHHPDSLPTHGLPTQHLAACLLALGPQGHIYTTRKDLGLKGNAVGWKSHFSSP